MNFLQPAKIDASNKSPLLADHVSMLRTMTANSATICNARWKDLETGRMVQCQEALYAKGWCQGHYRRNSRGYEVNVPLKAFKVKTDHVVLSLVNVPPWVYLALAEEADRQRKSIYALHQDILHEWADTQRQKILRNKRRA